MSLGNRKNSFLFVILFSVLRGAAAEGLPFVLQEAGRFDPKMENLSGVAIDTQDRLYVAGAPGVKAFDANGTLLRWMNAASSATCVAVDGDGFVYVGMRTGIGKFDSDGKLVKTWGKRGTAENEFRYVTGIAVSGGCVYVCDAGNRRVSRFGADGDPIDGISGFLIPSPYFDCAVDTKGTLYVAHTGEHRIERYDANMKLLGQWGSFGAAPDKFSGCCNPTNIALFPDGRIAMAEKGIPRLKVCDASGALLACLGQEAFAENAAGMDLAIDSRGRIALADPAGGMIRF